MFNEFSIDTGMDQGSLDLYSLGATTCKLGEDLAIWKHGIAESGEIICDQEENVALCCHEVRKQNFFTHEICC